MNIVYLPDIHERVEKFMVINSFDKMVDCLRFKKIKFLSIPPTDDGYDILDCIINNDINIKTIHIQDGDDLLARIRLFFAFAKAYHEKNIKNNIILKHEYLDTALKKITEKTTQKVEK